MIHNSISNRVCKIPSYISDKCYGHYNGAKSLYLFINLLNHTKYIVVNDLYNDKHEIDTLKKKIFKCGCISIKFTQWIISKLKGTNDNNKFKHLIESFEDIFERCA